MTWAKSEERNMAKIACPICGIQGFLQVRGSSARIQHYRGFVDGRGIYDYHRIPKSMLDSITEVNGSRSFKFRL